MYLYNINYYCANVHTTWLVIIGLLSSVDCGSPQPPVNGLVVEIASMREGSEVIFQCNASAVCSRDGRWSPDPGQQVCGFQSGSRVHIQSITNC